MLSQTTLPTMRSSNDTELVKKSLSASFATEDECCDSKSPENESGDAYDSKFNNSDADTINNSNSNSNSNSASSSAQKIKKKRTKKTASQLRVKAVHKAYEHPSPSSLAKRRSRIPKTVSKPIVDAVVLHRSGKISEMKYNTTPELMQAKIILDGRPTIIGEFEEISVIITRPMHSGCCGCKFGRNKHRLPFPFQNEEFCGDYLLYKVNNDNGMPVDFSIREYRAFQMRMRPKTEAALLKNKNTYTGSTTATTTTATATAVFSPSKLSSKKGSSLTILKRDIERRVRSEFQAIVGRTATAEEIEQSVNSTVDALIESLVTTKKESTSADQLQAQIADIQERTLHDKRDILNRVRQQHAMQTGSLLQDSELLKLWQSEAEETTTESTMTVAEFQAEMNEALANVRRLGRLDGQRLASSLAETFYEINGREPEVGEITAIFRRIKESLALEADEDLQVDDGSAKSYATKISPLNDASPAELVEYANRLVTEDLVVRSRQSFLLANGRKPDNYELRLQMIELFQTLVIESPDVSYAVVNDSEEYEADSDYNPENKFDQELLLKDAQETKDFDDSAVIDAEEDEKKSEEEAPTMPMPTSVKMIATPAKQKVNAVQYDVYFSESANGLSPAADAKNLARARKRFARMHKRKPTAVEVGQMKLFLTVAVDDPRKLSEFEVDVASVLANERKLQQMRAERRQLFLQEAAAAEAQAQAMIDMEEEKAAAMYHNINKENIRMKLDSNGKIVVLTTPVKNKRNCTRYNLYFDETEVDGSQNCEKGLEWFKKMCQRNPTKDEMQNLSQFVTADKSLLIKQLVDFNDESEDLIDVD
jgi:hypothetical protein